MPLISFDEVEFDDVGRFVEQDLTVAAEVQQVKFLVVLRVAFGDVLECFDSRVIPEA